jgi:hypothetical protein
MGSAYGAECAGLQPHLGVIPAKAGISGEGMGLEPRGAETEKGGASSPALF